MIITYTIIGITVLISMIAFQKESLMMGFMMNPWMIENKKQYYRFLTSGFIHGSHVHLLVNMFSFYFFGSAMERVFAILFGELGGFYFISLYFLAIIASDVPTYFKQRKNSGYNSLGASGGVAAVVFAFIIFLPLERICLYIYFCMPGVVFGVIYVLYSYYQGKKSNDGINHDAHLYGALFGLLFCITIYPAAIPRFWEQVSGWIAS